VRPYYDYLWAQTPYKRLPRKTPMSSKRQQLGVHWLNPQTTDRLTVDRSTLLEKMIMSRTTFDTISIEGLDIFYHKAGSHNNQQFCYRKFKI
jgi:hypothetical protein